MHANDFEKFAKKHNIHTVDVDGETGCGYACTYVYFDPESVIKHIQKWKKLYHSVNNMMAELGAEGEICAEDKLPCDVMSVLHEIDGGQYDANL